MEFKHLGFYPPKTVAQPIPIEVDDKIVKQAQEEFTRRMRESSDKIFRQQLGLEAHTPTNFDFEEELSRMIDKLTQLMIINISDEDMVKTAIEDLKKKESGINIVYITSPYIPQGQVTFIQEEELKHQMLNNKRKRDAEKKKEKTDGEGKT